MPITDVAEAKDLERSIERLFTAAAAQRPRTVRAIFVERLDFYGPPIVDVHLRREGLPPTTTPRSGSSSTRPRAAGARCCDA